MIMLKGSIAGAPVSRDKSMVLSGMIYISICISISISDSVELSL